MTTALVSLSILSSFAQSTKQWTLEECIDYALANNISLTLIPQHYNLTLFISS